MVTEMHNQEAEECVAGAMLANPEWALDVQKVAPPDAFFTTLARRVYEAILAVLATGGGGEVDTRDIVAHVAATPDGPNLGGEVKITERLCDLLRAYPDGGDPEWWAGRYVTQVRNDYIRRRAHLAASEVLALTQSKTTQPADILESLEKVARQVESTASVRDIAAVDALRELSVLREKGGEPRISTGYAGLDAKGAMVETGLYVIGARTGEGKSSLMANMAVRAAKSGMHFGFITLEMSRPQMVNSMLGIESGLNRKSVMENKLSESDKGGVAQAEQVLGAGNWWISDQEVMTVEDIAAQARIWVRRYGVKILFVDHLQRIRATDTSVPRHLQIGHITWALKTLARQLKIVIVTACQINREGAKEGAPRLHHFKESGSVEEDADGVLAIYVDRTKNNMDSVEWDAEIWWLKNRHGAIGTCPVKFLKASGRFLEIDTSESARQQFRSSSAGTIDGAHKQVFSRQERKDFS